MMMCKILIAIIYTINEIFSGHCGSKGRMDNSPLKICAKRKELEEQHYVNYFANEVIYRKWPEVQENTKHYCDKFVKEIFPKKKDLDHFTAEIRKVTISYKQIRDPNNNMITPQRVAALECRLSTAVWRRKYIYFIRSPQSPKCVLFLNRIGKRSFNFYIIVEVCENIYQNFNRTLMEELDEDKLEGIVNVSRRRKRRMFVLPNEEIKVKHAHYEQSHFEYYLHNTDMCKFWPEIKMNPNIDCQRFLRIILPKDKDLSTVIAAFLPTKLSYLEIMDDYNGRQDPIEVNAIKCQLPEPVRNHSVVRFIRAPSYPICVFYIIKKLLRSEYFSIAEEICDTLDEKLSLYSIILENEQSTKFLNITELLEYETIPKIPQYEWHHFQDYSIKQNQYEEWPELEEMDIKFYCQKIIENIIPQLADTYEMNKLIVHTKSVELKYATLSTPSAEATPLRKVKAFDCLLSGEGAPNQFLFIRTPKPNCLYWVKRKFGRQIFYIITREFCKDDK